MRARFGFAIVRGRSMLPTLRAGDRLLVRYHAKPSVGRLLVVRLPDGVVAVKRAMLLDESGWWVARDNPDEGVDSWTYGWAVPRSDVLAVVVGRVWPQPGRAVLRAPHRPPAP